METMSDLLEEITWQGEFNGQKIVMTAHHVIWLGKESDRFQTERKECECQSKNILKSYGTHMGRIKDCGCQCHEPAKPSTDTLQRAREIYEKLDTRWLDGDMISLDEQDKLTKRDIQAIASYGEERYQKGLSEGWDERLVEVKTTEREGYRRGIEEAAESISDIVHQIERRAKKCGCDSVLEWTPLLAERIRGLATASKINPSER
jgi:hypothetical protein